MDFTWLLPYLYGAFGGIIWALMGAGYHKIGNPDFSFSGINFIKTIIIGLVIGAVAVYYGQPLDLFGTTTTALTITAIIDRIINMLIKKATA